MGRRRTIVDIDLGIKDDLSVYRAELARIPNVTEAEAKRAAAHFVAAMRKAKERANG